MKYSVTTDVDYDQLLKLYKRFDNLPGNEEVITSEEFGEINRMTDGIVRYYREAFELDEYNKRDKENECTITIEFRLEDDPVYDRFEPEYWEDIDVDYSSMLFMKEIFKSEAEKAGAGSRLDGYFGSLDKKRDEIGKRIPDDKVKYLEEIAMDAYDSTTNSDSRIKDLYAAYSFDHIVLFYSMICFRARLEAALNGKDERKQRLGLIESVLSHEMFHFFHDCCYKEEGGIFLRDDDYSAHIQESLAEYFKNSYMRSDHRLTDEAEVETGSLDVNEFLPGEAESDGGYSGSVLLSQYIYDTAKPGKQTKDNEKYKDIFKKSLSENGAKEVCSILESMRDCEDDI